MAVLLPKAPDLRTYWRNILTVRDCITEVPADHSWAIEDYFDADQKVPDKTYCRRGGFLDKVPFDPMEFGLPPSILDAVDTSQLLGLIVAREALRDAGLDPEKSDWPKHRTACILGATGTQELAITLGSRLQGPIWRKAMRRYGVDESIVEKIVADIGRHHPDWQEQSFPGLLGNVISGRITNRFDLGGTNCVVDAACASSFAAMQLAISDLHADKCDIAISGGVDTLNDIFMQMCFSKTPALSKAENARPFDVDADGTLIAEGLAMVVLKRLSDAEKAGDRIYAIVKGMGSSSDGRFKSIYAPASHGQTNCLRRAYDDAGVPIETVELVEAHGTGTRAGDVAEVDGLKGLFQESTRPGRHVAIGSVKSQIGHSKSTAGAAGLVKAALALYQRVLPPTAKVALPNPKMGFEQSKLYVNSVARPWVRAADHPRRAGVSSFGFGGSNFHVVLEEYGAADRVVPLAEADEQLLLVGAADRASMLRNLEAAIATMRAAPTVEHGVHEVLRRFQPGRVIVSFSAPGADVVTKLESARDRLQKGDLGLKDGVWIAEPGAAKVGVLFPGQGSQYVDMGRSLAVRHGAVRAAFDRADEAFRQAGRPALSEKVFPPPAFTDAEKAAQQAALTATEWAQPAIGAASKGMYDLLARFGVQASAFAGHSYGELVALCAAGAYDEDALWTASRVRGEAMADRGTDRGTMAAVSGPLDEIAAVIADIPGVLLANRNHPTQGVISGTRDAVQAAIDALGRRKLSAKLLSVSAAFHSPLVADAAEPFAAALADLPFGTPAVPVYSNVTARPYEADGRALLARQITSPVDFVGVIEAMYADGVRVFVECGPKAVLSGLVRKVLEGREFTVVTLDSDKIDGDAQLKRGVAALAAAGVAVSPDPILAEILPRVSATAPSKATVMLGGANYKKPENKNPPPPTDVPKKAPAPAAPVQAKDAVIGQAAAVQAKAAPVADAAPAVLAKTMANGAPPASPRAIPAAAPVRAAAAPAPQANGVRSNGVHAPSPVPVTAKAASTPISVPKPAAVAAVPGAPMSQRVPPDAHTLAALLESTRQSLLLFQQSQERTAGVHAKFLDAHTRANESFATLFQTHAQLVGVAAGLPVAPAAFASAPVPPPAYAPSTPVPAYTPAPAVYAAPPAPAPSYAAAPAAVYAAPTPAPAAPAKNGSHVDALAHSFLAEAEPKHRVTAGPTARPRVADDDDLPPILAQTGGGVVAAKPAAAPVRPQPDTVRSAPKGGRDTIVAAMLTTVAEKTGYPRDMLELGMDMESDLGIDSIKRVEILSSVQEQVPGLPELDNDKLSSLRTLEEVIAYLDALAGNTASTAPAPVNGHANGHAHPAPAAPANGVRAGGRAAIVAAMLTTVAEKTGYPRDMLELGMDMESDLGIDSIKRVEILSAVQEQVPGLPELDNDKLSSLRTLDEVIGYLDGLLPGAAAGGAAGAAQANGVRSSGADDVVAAMMATVAEKTGYPRDMLELGMDLESDLGIDSIKRVEILSAVQEKVPGLPELDNDRLSSLRTVGEVCEYLSGLLGATTVESEAPASVELPARRRIQITPAPSARPVTLLRSVAVVGDAGSEAQVAALSAALASLGVRPGAVEASDAIVFVGLGPDSNAANRQAFQLARTVGARARWATVSGLGGKLGFADRNERTLDGALAGLTKTLAQEWADTACVHVDVDPGGFDAELLAREILSERGVVEVGLGSDGVVTTSTVEEALVDRPGPAPIVPGDLVVVSGGARGVTAAVVLEMARRWRPRLLLLGRSAIAADPAWARGVADDALKPALLADAKAAGRKLSPKDLEREVGAVLASREANSTMAAVRALGATVEYAAVDVRDPSSVAAAVRATGAPVRGLVHGAGVIADKLVSDKTDAQFDLVYGTKVDGLFALLSATHLEDLAFAAFFGSVAGRFGNRGQCDYAMGNEVLAKTALALRDRGVRSVCFDWGPWEAGMVTPALKKQLAARGMAMIGLDGGARTFCLELEQADPPAEVVIGGPEHGGPLVGKTEPKPDTWTVRPSDAFVADHQVSGRGVIPMAMILDRFAGLAAARSPRFRIDDLRVLKGIIVEAPTDIHLSMEPVAGGLEVRAQTGSVLHYRAVIRADVPAPTMPPMAELRPWPLAVPDTYRDHLFHGPAFHAIEDVIGVGDHAIAVRVSPAPDLGAGKGRWDADPWLVDGALQAMLLWVGHATGLGALPTEIGSWVQHLPVTGPVVAHLRLRQATRQSGSFDVWFLDDRGVVAEIRGGRYAASPAIQHRAAS